MIFFMNSTILGTKCDILKLNHVFSGLKHSTISDSRSNCSLPLLQFVLVRIFLSAVALSCTL